jgi:2-haloalkanoic acid dehalogenase type II
MAPKVATFDCYGTLIDWEGGIASFLYALLLREEVEDPPPGRQLRTRWEEIQFELIQGDYKPYKDILAETTVKWCADMGIDDAEIYGPAIVGSMRAWQPFPDTRPALTKAQEAGMKLVILSNTDRDIISHSVKHMGVEFDKVVTAEDVGSYKPSIANFERLLEELDEDPADIVHVAFGFKYDIGPAKQMGMGSAWVNRHQEPLPDPAIVPDHEWKDLWGLAELASSS